MVDRFDLAETKESRIEILSEDESHRGWRFHARAHDDDGASSTHEITLDWADYNLWSPGGSIPPARVVEAVLIFLREQLDSEQIGEQFDASIARRRFPDADERIARLIRD